MKYILIAFLLLSAFPAAASQTASEKKEVALHKFYQLYFYGAYYPKNGK